MVSIATRAGLIEVFEASETSLKKPPKAKPKKRAKQPAPAAAAVSARLKAPVVLRAVAASRHAAIALAQPRRAPAVSSPATARFNAGSVCGSYSRDDRAVLGLLLLPFLAVAISLATGQVRRTSLAMPDIAIRAPAQPAPFQSAAVPPPTIPVPTITAPSFIAPGQIVYPPAQPEISIASLDVRLLPPPSPAVPIEMTVPGPALAYPPPPAEVTIASLDIRPPVPLPAPPPQVATEATCRPTSLQLAAFSSIGRMARTPRAPLLTGVDAGTFGRRLSDAAVAQSRDLVIYTARYQPMAYPMGDVVPLHGACIDVIIRAYRVLGIDLQEEVQKARGRRGDTNIDHRRTENMRKFLASQGASLPVSSFPEDYKPGDIVTYHRPFSRVSTSHIAVVTDILAPTGRPMIVHNRGYGAQLEDALFVDRITGHYRYWGPAGASAKPTAASSSAAASGAPVIRASLPTRQARAPHPTTDAVERVSPEGPRPK